MAAVYQLSQNDISDALRFALAYYNDDFEKRKPMKILALSKIWALPYQIIQSDFDIDFNLDDYLRTLIL